MPRSVVCLVEESSQQGRVEETAIHSLLQRA